MMPSLVNERIPKVLVMPAYAALTDAVQRVDSLCFAQPWPLSETGSFLALAGEQLRGWIMHTAFVAICDGRVVGFVSATIRDAETQIHRLAVLPNYRRQGIARQLLSRLERQALERRSPAVAIVLRESNLAGQVYFRDRGYLAPREGALQADAFADGETGVVMAKAFATPHAPVKVRRA